jgi:hypothetical protein
MGSEIVITDIDEYLSRAEVEQLRTFPRDATGTKEKVAPVATEPVLLSTTAGSDPVSLLNYLCQRRGITPHYTYREVQQSRFTGTIEFLDQIIPKQGEPEMGPFSSKKDVKVALAVRAVAFLNGLSDTTNLGQQDVNWVGRLQGRRCPHHVKAIVS